jgi:hypothetical protein
VPPAEAKALGQEADADATYDLGPDLDGRRRARCGRAMVVAANSPGLTDHARDWQKLHRAFDSCRRLSSRAIDHSATWQWQRSMRPLPREPLTYVDLTGFGGAAEKSTAEGQRSV